MNINGIEKLEEKYEALGEEIRLLKEQQVPALPDWVTDDSPRYTINGVGRTVMLVNPLDKTLAYETGLLFMTKMVAEGVILKLQTRMKILLRIHELNDGWESDWNDNLQVKACITFHTDDREFRVNTTRGVKHKPATYYFHPGGGIGETLIREFGEDLHVMVS